VAWKVRLVKLFVKQDVAAVFAGESLIIKSPALFVSKQLLELPSTTQRELVLRLAIEQLPEKTRGAVKLLAKSWGGAEAFDIMKTNGVEVKWPWVDEVPQLLAITPEVAVSSTTNEKDWIKDQSLIYTLANQSCV
jgi:hypothetical protein